MISVTLIKDNTKSVFSKSAVERIVRFVCQREKIRRAELSIVLVNDTTIRKINKEFLKHNFVTDVITFPLEQDEVNAEIYINNQQVKRQAREHLVTQKNEMTRLIVHGVLHAIGYADTSRVTRKKMESIQERYVVELSLNK